jgi:hypothetical protein
MLIHAMFPLIMHFKTYLRIVLLKPGNFSDPRKIAFVTAHLLLIFQIVNVDFIFEYKLTVNVHLCIRINYALQDIK